MGAQGTGLDVEFGWTMGDNSNLPTQISMTYS